MITLDSFSSLGEAPRALVQDVLGGRAPHAVLITGIAGTGKRTLARLLACALLCVGEGRRPCMQCKGCRRVLAGTHPDLLTPSCTDKDRTIKVDHLREVLRALSFHALEGRRVILLENAQRMTEAAQRVKTGMVTYAVRDSEWNGVHINTGDIIGLHNGAIEYSGNNVHDVVMEMMKAIVTDEDELITVYYGADTQPEDAEAITAEIQDVYGNCDVECHMGGQPLYYYLISVE